MSSCPAASRPRRSPTRGNYHSPGRVSCESRRPPIGLDSKVCSSLSISWWVPNHVDTSGSHFIDATTTQAVIAGATTRIKVGSMLTLLPLHNPVVMAKAICTLDWLSGGRAAMTVGLGWQEDEYRALGVPWSERGSRMDDYLGAMLELWHSDSPRFDGEHISFADIVFEPKPVQRPHPPLWVGGDVDASLRRAARFGDGWAPWLTPPT